MLLYTVLYVCVLFLFLNDSVNENIFELPLFYISTQTAMIVQLSLHSRVNEFKESNKQKKQNR